MRGSCNYGKGSGTREMVLSGTCQCIMVDHRCEGTDLRDPERRLHDVATDARSG